MYDYITNVNALKHESRVGEFCVRPGKTDHMDHKKKAPNLGKRSSGWRDVATLHHFQDEAGVHILHTDEGFGGF